MSSSVFYYFACGTVSSDVAAWILASILFILGIVYFILYCCGGSGTTREVKEQMI